MQVRLEILLALGRWEAVLTAWEVLDQKAATAVLLPSVLYRLRAVVSLSLSLFLRYLSIHESICPYPWLSVYLFVLF